MFEPEFGDVQQFAKIISNMEVVITVDSLCLHLAGSMGKRTIALLGDNVDWKYAPAWRDKWYPTVEYVDSDGLGFDRTVEKAIKLINETT